MLLSRGKSELEASMENAVFRVDEIPQIVESFQRSQADISKGRLDDLISGLNEHKGVRFGDDFREEDFKDATFMTDQNLLSAYASAVGFYPFAVGFVFPQFQPIVAKLLSAPSGTRGIYIIRKIFSRRPFSDTGVVFVDGHELDLTFMHYKELTMSSQFQYAKSHEMEHFRGPKHLRLAYQLELALLREILSIYVLNKEFSRNRGISLERKWNGFWDSVKEEFFSNYLPVYGRMVAQVGGTIPQELESKLRRKINITFDLMKNLYHRSTREMVDTFFRFGTMPADMEKGRLYSPLNDIAAYFR